MVTLGIGRTQALATHVGRWCEAIFALSGYLYGAGVVQNMAIFGVKIRHLWLASSRVKIPPGNGFMCHITPQCMEQYYLVPLLPSPGTHPGFQGSKIWLFWGQNQATVAGCYQGGNNIWKGFNEPYPTPIHRITLLGSIFVLSVYIFRVAGVNRRLLGQIQAIVAGCPLQ